MNNDQKIEEIHDYTKRLTTALSGDEKLGVKGLIKNFDDHVKEDTERFGQVGDAIKSLADSNKSNKAYIKGALAVMGILVVIVNIFIALYK